MSLPGFPHDRRSTKWWASSLLMRLAAVGVLALGAVSLAQQAIPPAAPPVEVPVNGLQKWFADLDAQWRASYKRDIDIPHDEELEKIGVQYLASVEVNITKASAAGDLDQAILWRTERNRFAAVRTNPDNDNDAPALKQVRTDWRTQVARVEKDRQEQTVTFQGLYDQILARTQTQLTQQQRIDDALLVKAKREAAKVNWPGTLPTASSIAAATSPAPAAVVSPPVPRGGPGNSNPSKLPPREIVEKILALGGKVRTYDLEKKNARHDVIKISDAPEKFGFYGVQFYPRAGVTLTEKELAILQEVPDLAEVGFHDLPLTDVDLQPLRALRNLKLLELDKLPNLAGMRFDFLPEIQGLQSIKLSAMPASDGLLKALEQGRGIQNLTLLEMTLTDSGLASISRFPALLNLDLIRVQGFGAAGLAHLSKVKHLNRFTIDTPVLDHAMMSEIANMDVGNLFLLPTAPLDETGVIPLGKMIGVNSMTLINPPMTPAVLAALRNMRTMKQLRIGKKTPEANAEKLRAELKGVDVRLAP